MINFPPAHEAYIPGVYKLIQYIRTAPYTQKNGGGALMDFCVYGAVLMYWIFGKQDSVQAMVGDIRSTDDVRRACQGMDIIFQTAAAVWDLNTPEKVYDEVNVKGNQIVIDTCRRLEVTRLVYTSTMDVVIDGWKPIVNGDESLPYPERLPRDPYCRTKIIAEQMVIASNGPELLTCALRPVGMYGPRDKYHLANIIKVAKSKMNIRLGDGSARFSHVYSENAARAHILAAKHLKPGSYVA
ncbi:hypothetical protein ES703_58086 [subsurface metagenome]